METVRVLCDAINGTGDITLNFPRLQNMVLKAWAELVQDDEMQLLGTKELGPLLALLKAADYLADEAGVQHVCEELGRRLFEGNYVMANVVSRSNSSSILRGMDEPDTVLRGTLVSQDITITFPRATPESILDLLPSHLAVCVVQGAGVSLFRCLTSLPNAYHPLVLCAHFPAITRTHSCHLESRYLHSAPPSPGNLRDLFAALATFTSLRELHMAVAGIPPDTSGDIAHSFEELLMRCWQLQRIAVDADHFSQGFLTGQVASVLARRLPQLAYLKKLKLHACSELTAELDDHQAPGSVRSTGLGFRDLFAAVCRCTALEELRLTMMLCHEGVASDRDHFMASSLAALPSTLQVLALRSSVTGGCLRALDARLSGHATESTLWLPQLRQLDVAHSFLADHGIRALVPILSRLHALEMLDLSDNEITVVGAERLAPVLHTLTLLRRMDIRDNRFEDKGLVALCAAWDHLSRLEHLDVSYCDVSMTGSVALAKTLARLTNLQHLHMKGCKLTMRLWERDESTHDSLGAATLADALKQHRNLRNLSLVNTLLKSDAMALLAPSLALQTLLTSLELHFNIGFASLGLEALSRCLLSLRNLESLCMSCFDVSKKATLQFSSVLSALTKLRRLGLLGFDTVRDAWALIPGGRSALEAYAGTGLSGAGTATSTAQTGHDTGHGSGSRALAAALGQLSALEELQVMSCGFTSDCAPNLAASFRRMPHLRTLQMDNNPLRDEGIASIAPALRQLTQLRWLTMASTDLTLVGATAAVVAVQGHKKIERCALSVSDFSHRLEWPEVLRQPWVSIY